MRRDIKEKKINSIDKKLEKAYNKLINIYNDNQVKDVNEKKLIIGRHRALGDLKNEHRACFFQGSVCYEVLRILVACGEEYVNLVSRANTKLFQS